MSEVERFACGGLRGEVVARWRPADLAGELARLTDPGQALETLHWGRNYIYRVRLSTPEGPLEVAVKQFRCDSRRQRLRRWLGGGKAARSWAIARAMRAAGVPTPEPVLVADPDPGQPGRPEGPSYFVTRHLAGVVEARYLFRAINAGRAAEEWPGLDVAAFLTALARTLRRLHDAGFWHRDLSSGNVLVRGAGAERGPAGVDSPAEPELWLIDLNRARRVRRLGVFRRSRDLSRLMIFRDDDRRLFLDAYWGGRTGPAARGLHRLFHRAFLLKNDSKARVRGASRGVTRWLRDLVLPRKAHPHIPPAPEGAATRDRVVWDPLSDQPHHHAGKAAKLRVRLTDAPRHAAALAAAARAAPRIRRRYRELARGLYREPVPFGGLGVCLRPAPPGVSPEALLAAVEGLGVRHLLLRLHPWQERHDAEEELARELAARGYDLAFSLPQNRDLVRDPARWRAAVEELGERFTPYGRAFQVGQAINRSKWGVWTLDEYLDLAAAAAEALRRHPGIELLGPAVIDFEPHATAAAVNLVSGRRRAGLRFDALASLLYVDRRGAPESRQGGLDTAGKVTLLRAIADTARSCAGRSWITEVNWPLREGPHAPAGRSVAVDEETQADYLVRYYLLALGTGLVERVYWWQLVARGYGLATPDEAGGLRLRPAYRALATLQRMLGGATFLGPIAQDGTPITGAGDQGTVRLYRFRTPEGIERIAGWSTAGPTEIDLAGTPVRRAELSGAPRYFDRAPE